MPQSQGAMALYYIATLQRANYLLLSLYRERTHAKRARAFGFLHIAIAKVMVAFSLFRGNNKPLTRFGMGGRKRLRMS